MFIELKESKDDKIVINSEKIVYFTPDKNGTIIFFQNSDYKNVHCRSVMEDYETVKEVLKVKGTAKKQARTITRAN